MNALEPEMNALFDALGQSDSAEVRRILDRTLTADCHFDSAIGTVIEGRHYVGPSEIAGFMDELMDAFTLRYEDRRFEQPSDDLLVIYYDFTASGRGSGVEVSYLGGVIWRLRDGLIASSTTIRSHDELSRVIVEEMAA